MFALFIRFLFGLIAVSMLLQCLWAQSPSEVITLARPYTSFQSLNTEPQLITDGNNGIVIIYRSKRANLPNDQIYFQRVDADGNKIPNQDGVPVCASPFTQSDHVACSNRKGGVFVVWEEGRQLRDREELYIQKLNGRGENEWNAKGIRVCASEKEQLNPRIVSDDHGGVYVFWEEERNILTGKDIYGQHFDSQGRPVWGFYGKPIVRNRGTQQNITLVPARNNMVYVIWEDFRPGKGWKIMAQKVNYAGETQWIDEGILISQKEKNNAKNPRVCPDNFGGFFCVYQAVGMKTHQQDIFLARISPYNDVLYHKTICDADEEQNDVQVATDGDKVVVFWRDYRNGNGDIYAQKFNLVLGTENWETNGKLICSGITEQTDPQLVIPTDTSARLLFYQNKILGKDIYFNRLHNRTYETNIDQYIPVARIEGDQYQYRILVNDNRTGVWIAWVDEIYGDHNTIRYQFYGFDGQFRFKNPRGGENILAEHKKIEASVDNATMVLGKHHDIYVAWEDKRSGQKNSDIYIQRLDSVGRPLWGNAGRLVCGAVGEQSVPRLLSMRGGIVVGWSDRRNNDDDIYIQYFDTSGISQWEMNGKPLCTAPKTQNYLQMVPLDYRTFLCTWTDARDFYEQGFDIYYQIMDVHGRKKLTQGGEPVEKDATYQSAATVYAHGKKAGLAWMDERTGPYNIRSQWINFGGYRVWNKSQSLAPNTAHQRFPKAVVNDSGMVFTAWNDDRNGNLNTKVFLQKTDTSGKNLWQAGGLSVSGTPGRQSSVDVMLNDKYGIFVSWLDQRHEGTSGYNLYLQRINPAGQPEWHKDGISVGEFLTSFNPYQLHLGTNCNLLVTWSQSFSEHMTKVFWAEMDVDNGNIKRRAIVDADDGSQLRPSIVQMPDYSIGVLWLHKEGFKSPSEVKLGIYKPDDLKTSQGE